MKRATLGGLCLFLVVLFSFGLQVADQVAMADKLFDQGGPASYK